MVTATETQVTAARAAIVDAQATGLAALTHMQQLREAVRAGIFTQRDQIVTDSEHAFSEAMRALTSARVRLAALEAAETDREEQAQRAALVADRHRRELWLEERHPELLAAIADAEAEERALLTNPFVRDSGVGQMELAAVRRKLVRARDAFTAGLALAPAAALAV